MSKVAKALRFLTILVYFLAISGVNTRTVHAEGAGCSAAAGNGHFNENGDYVCDGKASPDNPSPVFSTVPGTGNTAKTPDQVKPLSGASAPIFGASGNDCERQAMIGVSKLEVSGYKGYLTTATTPGSIKVGDKIVIAGATPDRLNGTFTVSAINGTKITYDIPNTGTPSTQETATGSPSVRPDNVATGQDCIDQMSDQIEDLQDRINQLQTSLDPMMGDIESNMQRMTLDQQQQYAQGLQEMLNQFLGGGTSNNPFSSMMSQVASQANANSTVTGDPSKPGASYKSGAGACDVNTHTPQTTKSPNGTPDIQGDSKCTAAVEAAGGQKAVGGFDKCIVKGGDAASGAKTNDTFQQVTDMLGSREGFTNTAGWDNIHYTNGIGHLCSSGECTKGTYWSNDKVIEVFKQDLTKFWPAAQQQVDSLCINDSCFFTHIMSVCWQLGPNWITGQGNNGKSRPGLKEAWQAMQQGNFTQAMQQIERARSWWTTKNRVDDLLVALKSMIGQPTCGGKTIV